MATVKGPLLSLSASGTFGKNLVFQRRVGQTTVYRRVVPYDYNSPAQYAMRVYMGEARRYWNLLTPGYKTSWNDFVRDHCTFP